MQNKIAKKEQEAPVKQAVTLGSIPTLAKIGTPTQDPEAAKSSFGIKQTAIGSRAGPLILIATVDLPPPPARTDLTSINGNKIQPLTMFFGLPQAHPPAEPPALETFSAITVGKAAEAQFPFALDNNFQTTSSSNLILQLYNLSSTFSGFRDLAGRT